METSAYLAVYMVLISSAFCIVLLTLLGYSILAPWYKTTIGRLQWFLWLALMLVLLVPFLEINFRSVIPFRYFISSVTMLVFNIVVLFCGYGIYTTQIKAYLKRRKEAKQ